ncbi:MAG: helix-turn-helix domain-containing protein, partial [Nostoc sp.]|uniref:TetR/AcrR family transcriptional regulator n=1 Tax=Nostoc sp. TaxID=1180 RepID=UPI002FF16E0F
MRVVSDMSSLNRRTPQRPRGERRVAELLAATAEVLAKVGYEATTMSAISERAKTSMGTVYQYYPNKEAIVRALYDQYGEELDARWTQLMQEAAGLSL